MNEAYMTFWSGVGTVTGANFCLEIAGKRILVDCGLLQGTPEALLENSRTFDYDPSDMDYLFVTHAHADHIGTIPKLVKDGLRGAIYSTEETKALATLMFTDALHLMQNGETGTEPLFDEMDVSKTMSLWQTIAYHKPFSVTSDLSVVLFDAGHILGSAIYKFVYKNKDGKITNIVFTGDTGNSPSILLRDTETVADAHYMVLDSVYGDRNHEGRELREQKFVEAIRQTIQNKGTLVIPTFSIERTQVILYMLNNLVEDGVVPSIPIFLDSPLAAKVTEVYRQYSEEFNKAVQKDISGGDEIFTFPKLSITWSRRDSQAIEKTASPKIILAGSGMSSGGRVVDHEARLLPDPNTTLLLMGYQAPGTLGRQIEDGATSVVIKGETVPIRAKVEKISGFSGHRDSDHLVEFALESQATLRQVFVVLGEPKSSLYLSQRLRDEDIPALYPERGKKYKLEV